jgi:hypothetical protein
MKDSPQMRLRSLVPSMRKKDIILLIQLTLRIQITQIAKRRKRKNQETEEDELIKLETKKILINIKEKLRLINLQESTKLFKKLLSSAKCYRKMKI